MAEIKLDAPEWEQFAADHYISMRVGEAQKLGKLAASRTYKFPASIVGNRKYGKIEIFKRVGSGIVCIDPTMVSGVREVNIDFDGQSLSFGAEVRFPEVVKPGADKDDLGKKAQLQSESKKRAAEYLQQHNLEARLSEAMQVLLRERPADPAAFLAERLVKSSRKAAPATGDKAAARQTVQSDKTQLAGDVSRPPVEGTSMESAATPMPRHLLPSIGSYHGPSAFGGVKIHRVALGLSESAAKRPVALLPSVGTWLQRIPATSTSEEPTMSASSASTDPLRRPVSLMPSVGTWLQPAKWPADEITTSSPLPSTKATSCVAKPLAAGSDERAASLGPSHVSVTKSQPTPEAASAAAGAISKAYALPGPLPVRVCVSSSTWGPSFWGTGIRPCMAFI